MNVKDLVIIILFCGVLSASLSTYIYTLPKSRYTLQGPIIEKAANAEWGAFIVIEANPKNHRAITHLTDAEFAKYHIGQIVKVSRMRDVFANQWDEITT